MIKYTLGFIFNPELDKVLLVHKQRPDWQKGRLNGIGGKIEPGEESIRCIVREVAEECGLNTNKDEWVYLGKIRSPQSDVDLYTLVWRDALSNAMTCGDEEIAWFPAHDLPGNAITNLSWLIPLAKDKIKHGEFSYCEIYYP